MASLTHVCMWSDKGLEANFGGTSRKITILEGQCLLAAACLCVNFADNMLLSTR